MPLTDAYLSENKFGYNPDGDYGVTRSLSVISDPGIRRPYFDKWGKPAVTINSGRWTVEKGERVPIKESIQILRLMNQGIIDPIFLTANATSMRKEQWIELDRVVIKEYRLKLTAWEDLMAANSYGGFNGMARLTMEYEAMSDPGQAVVDMDGLGDGRTDSPLFKLRSMPLPITHSDFWFSERRLEISGNGGMPFDLTMAEAGARRIGESIERTTIGTQTGITYGTETAGYGTHDGTSTVYGYTNHPNRFTKTDFTAPTAGGWVPNTTYNELLSAIATLKAAAVYGPYQVYYSSDWFTHMSKVFAVSGGNNSGETLISMLQKIPGISGVKELEFLTSTFTFIIVKMASEVARAVNGRDITTLQWPSQGGMRTNFKIMCIQVPQVRASYSNVCGILHGTTA